ncbi:MAG: hypothetical protein PUF08_06650 [Clostridiales bacterium]|nr:hypothetical protein [Clostridiales bacterium]
MDTFTNIMETMMVICFGISWPLNIIKAWKAKTAKGTSLIFYFFIWIGYIFALIGKIAMINATPYVAWYDIVPWYVMFFYVLNILMVSGGIILYFRNKVFDKRRVQK